MDALEAIDLLTRTPDDAGIVTDFDGTLSEIVDRPEAALPVPSAVQTVEDLAERFGLVAVVSGRSLEDLRERFAPRGVVLAGSYGRERSDLPAARRRAEGWEPVAIAAVAATEEMPGVIIERKGAGVAIHYRKAPQRAEDVRELARTLARSFELEVRPGRLVAELVAPGPGKGEAVERLVGERGLGVCMYGGDDVADLEAFEALRGLDVEAVCVAVTSEESPPELEARADLVVSGPREYLEFLARLTRPAGS